MKVSVIICVLLGFGAAFASSIPVEDSKDGISGRILGGSYANRDEIDYMASVRYMDDEHFCGGFIYSIRWIVSSASCTFSRPAATIYAVIGSMYRTIGGTKVAIGLIVNHPDYIGMHGVNDISLLLTTKEIMWDIGINAIPINPNYIESGEEAVISGWGGTVLSNNNDGYMADHLKAANVVTISYEECATSFGVSVVVDDGLICTSTKTGKGTAWGDNGSPLVAHGGVIGIAVMSDLIGIAYPTTYSRISYYYDWIVSVAGS